MNSQERWYSIEGRITRMTWFARVFGGGLAMLGTVMLLRAMAPGDPGDPLHDALRIPILGLILGFLVFRFMQDIKRLHDLGKSGFWVVCAFVPLVNLIYVGFLLFGEGQPFTNDFGPDPLGRGTDIDEVVDAFR